MRISSSRMAQMLENTGAAALPFTPAELAELNSAVPAIKVRCAVPEVVEVMSGVEAAPKV